MTPRTRIRHAAPPATDHARTRRSSPIPAPAALIALALLTLIGLAACGGDASPSPTSTASAGAGASPTGPASTPTAPGATATAGTPGPTPINFAAYYRDHCAVCHGSNRDGVGRTPPLTPDTLTDDIAHYLDETNDRAHSSIWIDTALTDTDRRALLEFLASTPP